MFFGINWILYLLVRVVFLCFLLFVTFSCDTSFRCFCLLDGTSSSFWLLLISLIAFHCTCSDLNIFIEKKSGLKSCKWHVSNFYWKYPFWWTLELRLVFVCWLFPPPQVAYIFTTVYCGIVTVILVIFILENYGLLYIKVKDCSQDCSLTLSSTGME